MTWNDDFEVDPAYPVKNEESLKPMLEHMSESQQNFKRVLEEYLSISEREEYVL